MSAALAVAANAGLEGRVSSLLLDNGMRWYFVERHTSPTFAGVVEFEAGGVDETPGTTGIAHMFEHMAFKGTEVIGTRDYEAEKTVLAQIEETADDLSAEKAKPAPDAATVKELSDKVTALQTEEKKYIVKDEFWEIYRRNGANGLNAYTSKDVTNYHVALPANRLELFCLMESQRLAIPVLREFYTERDVVREERRKGIETSPDGKLYERFIATAYTSHPYRWLVIGDLPDVDRLSESDARRFRQTYYVPRNAVGVLVGDFKTAEAKRLVKEYFGRLPAGPAPPPVTAVEPPQDKERRVEVEWDAEPQLLIGYHVPTYPHPDFITLQVIADLLTNGRSSRLYAKLVKEKELVTSVASEFDPGYRYPTLYVIEPIPRAPHAPAEAEQAIYEELERLKKEPVSEKELRKIKNQAHANETWGLASNMGLAHSIASYQQIFGDWRYYDDYARRVDKVTAADIMRVANEYFKESNRTVAVLKRPGVAK